MKYWDLNQKLILKQYSYMLMSEQVMQSDNL